MASTGLAGLTATAQTTPNTQPTTAAPAPAPAYNSQPGANTPLGGSSVTFTNTSGQAFTVEQLATQLRNLRAAVDQTLPMLTAFNQNAANGASQGLAGRLEGLVSNALNRNGGSPAMTNLLSSLRGMLGTQSGTTQATDAKTAQDLVTLQNDLQPIPSLLQGMNVGGSTVPNPSQVISAPGNARYNAPPANAPAATGR